MSEELEGRVMVADSATIATLNRSEIDIQIATAQKFPRSVSNFRHEMMQMVTLTEAIAQECIYSLPREGKIIEGPSARFAEVALSAWGNSRAGCRVVAESNEFITAQGMFHDLQRNVAVTVEVQRRVINKHGKRFGVDMIGTTGNAASSIALRNAILKGIPKAFWSDMFQAARATVMGDFKTLANRRAEAMKAMQAFGVDAQMVYEFLGIKGIDDMTREHLVQIGGLITTLRDGESTVEEIFAEPLDHAEKAAIKRPRKKQETVDTQTGEIHAQEQHANESPAVAQQTPEEERVQDANIKSEAPSSQSDGPLATAGMKKILRVKLQTARITDAQFEQKFGKSIDQLLAADINQAIVYASEQ